MGEVIEYDSTTCIVMEFVSGGDLSEYLARKGRLDENEARRLFQQLIAGVEHCHSRGVVHRDLKPENILLTSARNLKIADFGFSAEVVEGDVLTESCGSLDFAAPELLRTNCQYHGPDVDVWSCGVILYVLLCRILPFDAQTTIEIISNIRGGYYQVPVFVASGAKCLLNKMLKVNPEERISIVEIREDSWFMKNLPRCIERPLPRDDVLNLAGT